MGEIDLRLAMILGEMSGQEHLAGSYGPEVLSFAEEMAQIQEFIEVGEEGLAYESIVGSLENVPFTLTGRSAVALLEVGLFFGFKSDRPEDEWLRRTK